MTELEYIICEAERCGDINLETRNELLNVLYEADVDKVVLCSCLRFLWCGSHSCAWQNE